ncbi:hypothetical protein EV207_12554 [Scopulibacillus darangshiensis]|uniref:Uncharacterized protein n=1 Tax=Scopulibacillus darangshiensis TaxID=442528 RepID=A0A4R2NRF2_9BACL|nr:hypothetical protein [Scopulibacillus darangshiensis]TCP24493.1 hypothetical protein EV207_12554 [Scopulibacillus darangshiensis]
MISKKEYIDQAYRKIAEICHHMTNDALTEYLIMYVYEIGATDEVVHYIEHFYMMQKTIANNAGVPMLKQAISLLEGGFDHDRVCLYAM